MSKKAEIIDKPLDGFISYGGEVIAIWPWFDFQGKSQKLDRLWREYRNTRLKCGVPDNLNKVESDLSSLLNNAQRANEFCIILVDNGEIDSETLEDLYDREVTKGPSYAKHLKPFAVARKGLKKAVQIYLGLHTINDLSYYKPDPWTTYHMYDWPEYESW